MEMRAKKMKTSTVFLVLFSLCLSILSPLPASADAELLSAQPGVNESLAEAPTEIRLEFSSDIRAEDATITVLFFPLGPEEDVAVTDGPIRVDGNIVTQPLKSDLPDGQYFVLWDVTSLDGQNLVDSYEFAVGEVGEFPEAEAVAAQPITLSDELEAIYDEVFVAAYTFRDFLLASTILFVQASVALLTPLSALVVVAIALSF
jgi:methionine-rich copper-binding protein CopC